jgi:hypothetical protein
MVWPATALQAWQLARQHGAPQTPSPSPASLDASRACEADPPVTTPPLSGMGDQVSLPARRSARRPPRAAAAAATADMAPLPLSAWEAWLLAAGGPGARPAVLERAMKGSQLASTWVRAPSGRGGRDVSP